MSIRDDVERAFPVEYDHGQGGTTVQFGMSLRDYFAAKALAALIAHPDKQDENRGRNSVEKMASWAYEYADAMLEERA